MEPGILGGGRVALPSAARRRRWRGRVLAPSLAAIALALAAGATRAVEGDAARVPSPATEAEAGAVADGSMPDADPMTQLGHRLQRVLGARPAGDARGTHEIELPLRRTATTPRAARRRVDAHAGPRARAAPSWGYGDADGPARWAALDPAWSLCAEGRRQSPIDLRDGIAVDLPPLRFDYRPSGFRVVDTGRTVRVDLDAGNAIEVGGRRYALQHLSFRRPSEERIDGRQFEMSVQLQHRDADGRIAIVAVVLDEGPALPLVQRVWGDLPLERQVPADGHGQIDPSGLLPEARGYITYLGSLTTPPCTEGVRWIVMRQPMTVSRAQLDVFARVVPMNARPLQDAAGRLVKQSIAAD
jgi:carbonic anhydrase